jgi:hypothetical protein
MPYFSTIALLNVFAIHCVGAVTELMFLSAGILKARQTDVLNKPALSQQS